VYYTDNVARWKRAIALEQHVELQGTYVNDKSCLTRDEFD